jgi:prefoldin subunit 5
LSNVDNADEVIQQLRVLRDQMEELRADVKVLLEASRRQIDELEMVQVLREVAYVNTARDFFPT